MARPKKEKRLFPRKPICTKVVFENEDSEGILYFFSTDISIGGMFIESEIPIRIGTQVFLRFCLEEDTRPIQATSEVVRAMKVQGSEDGESGKLGIGLRFIYLHPEDKERIETFLSDIED